MRKDEKKVKEIIRLSFQFPVIRRSPVNISNPVLSKQSLHDYFADKMAAFSIIVGYIFDRLQEVLPQKGQLNSLGSLHKKLGKMQTRFLNRYHKLTSKTGNQPHVHIDLLKPIFEHINRFEKKVISEVINAGIRREELQEFNEKNLLVLSIKN